jgi:hypothetical protein
MTILGIEDDDKKERARLRSIHLGTGQMLCFPRSCSSSSSFSFSIGVWDKRAAGLTSFSFSDVQAFQFRDEHYNLSACRRNDPFGDRSDVGLPQSRSFLALDIWDRSNVAPSAIVLILVVRSHARLVRVNQRSRWTDFVDLQPSNWTVHTS